MDRYTGERDGEIRQGKGEYAYETGMFRYNGEWVNGVKHGEKCKFVVQGVSEYEGEFRNGEIEGSGVRRWDDGRVYTGEFHEGEMHGKGCWTHPNGERYEGEFEFNKRHGQGKLSNAQLTYAGGFKHHRFHGPGVLIRSDFSFLRGYFDEGKLSGNGDGWDVETGRYIGEWQAGQPHGQGRFLSAAPGSEVVGEFRDGLCIDSARFIDARVIPTDNEQQTQPPHTGSGSQKGGAASKPNKSAKQTPSKAPKGKSKQDSDRLLLPVHQQAKDVPTRIEVQLLRTLPAIKERESEGKEAETYEEPAQLASDKFRLLEIFACKVPDEIAVSCLRASPDRPDAVVDLEKLASELSNIEEVLVNVESPPIGEVASDARRFWTSRLWPELTMAEFEQSTCVHDTSRVLRCGEAGVMELEDDRGVKCVKQIAILPSSVAEDESGNDDAGNKENGYQGNGNRTATNGADTAHYQPITAVVKTVELPEYVSPTQQRFGLHMVFDFRLLPPSNAVGDEQENDEDTGDVVHSNPENEIQSGESQGDPESVLATAKAAEATHTEQLLVVGTPGGPEIRILVRYTNNNDLAAQITTVQTAIGENSLEWVVAAPTQAYEWHSVGVVVLEGTVEVHLNAEKLQAVRIRNSAMERWRRAVEEFESSLTAQSERTCNVSVGGKFEAHYKGPAIFWSQHTDGLMATFTSPFAQHPSSDEDCPSRKMAHSILCDSGKWQSSDGVTIAAEQEGLYALCIRDATSSASHASRIPLARPAVLLVEIV